MSWLSLADIAEMTGGSLLGGRTQNADVNAVSIDTRKVQPDDLFIAIKGERFDAHNFVDGLEGKVAGALVSKEIDCNVPQVLVEDTKLALAQLALAWRKRFKEVVIGLTGSNGKTTLKEMISAILSQEGNVLATLGNLNNDIGMPLTLLRLREEHDYAVIEMGANHFGEIDFLADIAKPNIAVINNAGPAHLEGFGDIEGVSRAKGEIFNGLVDDGIAIVNADDDYADYWKGLNSDKQVITFGLNNSADISGDYKGNGLLLIKINQSQSHPRSQTQQQVQLNLQGKHNAMNALAATAVATALGVELQTVKIGLESLAVVPGRLAMVEGLHGSKI
ncbi:MAG: UDP-N-acetylmuramoyl-tripeptide--D-alanyl-D-alanine ligase, partial [Thiotrichaceae bacterium]